MEMGRNSDGFYSRITQTDPITSKLAAKNTLNLQTILMVMVQTTAPYLGMEVFPVQRQACQEEQKVRVRA
jgi:hypothetical protein